MTKDKKAVYRHCQNSKNSVYKILNPLPRGLTVGAMPLDFGSAKDEAMSCQETVALFDYSFLLRLLVRGPGAIRGISEMCGRDFSDLPVGGIRYGFIADPNGWLVSDLTVWRSNSDILEIMSGRAKDVSYIKGALAGHDVKIVDLSQQTAVLALQGPQTNKVLSTIEDKIIVADIPYFCFRDLEICGVKCRIGRLGYTGLDGVEILCAANDVTRLWRLLSSQARPSGFSAANYLRLKAGLALFTHEFKPLVSAADVGLKRMRPNGKLLADQYQARVTRVCFSARILSETGNNEQVFSNEVWTPEDEFPPQPGTLAITSISQDVTCDRQIGMGYVVINEKEKSLVSASNFIKDIVITREFINRF